MPEKKTIFEEEVRCPHCKKYIEVKKIRKTIAEAVKGEYEDKIVVNKSRQSRLKPGET